MNKLTHKEALQALLDGHTVYDESSDNKYILHDDVIYCIQYDGYYFQTDGLINLSGLTIVPKTVSVNGVEVPEPLREAPTLGTRVYVPFILDADKYNTICWGSSPYYSNKWQLNVLNLGLVHSTKEAAIAHADALLKPTTMEKK